MGAIVAVLGGLLFAGAQESCAVGLAGSRTFAPFVRMGSAGLGSTTTLGGFASERKTWPTRPARLTSVVAGWLIGGTGASADRTGARALPLSATSTPTLPFTECPAIGNDTSCGILLEVTNSGVSILQDPSQGPFDGADDTLVGVLNQSNKTLGHIELSSDSDIFGFDGDGICSGDYGEWNGSAGCPYGPTGYEGPGTEFVDISPDQTSGAVDFNPGIPPGGTAYFSLEEPLTSSTVVSGGPSVLEQGGAPNGSENSTTCGAGDPVNCATGVFWREFTDVSIPGRGVPLKFSRTYSSLDAETDGPLGYGWADSYDMSLSIDSETGAARVREETGSEVTFPSNGAGGFTTPPRVLATLVDNGDGTYTFSRYADHVQYVFSEAGQLLREVDRNGNTTTLTYSGGLLEKVTDPSGRSLTFTYTGSQIHTITDPLGRTTTFGYDASGDLVSVTDPLRRTWSFAYNADHLLLSMTDPRGGTTTNTYNATGQVIAQVDPAARETTWSYMGEPTGPGGGTTTMTDARGDVTVYDYKNLELMSVTHGASTPSEATTSYQYDPITLGVTSVTDPDDDVTQNTYDEHGELASSTDSLGHTTYYTYDAMDDLTSMTDPRGTPTYYAYDGSGNLLEKETLLTETDEYAKTTYSYEGEPGEVTAVIDPGGNTTKYSYDSAGDRTSMTDPDGNTTTYSYDADGELTAEIAPVGNVAGGDPAAHTTSYTYDADGELTDETDPLGHTTSYAYDSDGNRISITDANGHTTRQVYDPDNELTEVIRPDGSTLKTQWDEAGNMVAQIDGSGHATTYAYDPLARLIAVTDPDGHTTSYRYDPAGRKTAMVNAEGETTEYGYDADGELVSISYSDGTTPDVSERYDEDGNRVEMVDGSGTSAFTYDSLNRMTSAAYGSGATVKYAYDLDGQLTALTYPNGKTVTRSYDAAGHLDSVTDWLGNTTHFAYDADSNLTGEQYPNGVDTQLAYDAADRLTGIADTNDSNTLASFDYTRDPVGDVTSEASENGEPSTTNYGYDSLDRLTSANSTPYGYDAADNPTTFGSATQAFDPANELTSSATPSGPVEAPEEKVKVEGESSKEKPQESPKESTTGTSLGSTGGGTTTTTTPEAKSGVEAFHASHTPPTVDAVLSAKAKNQGKLISPKLRTHSFHDLVLAFVSASGPSSSIQRVTRVSGDGLHWTLLALSDGASGAAEVWQAHASRRLSGPVTVRLRDGGYPAEMTIAAFAGPAGASPSLVAHATSQGHASAPSSRLTPAAGTLLWAVGHSTGQKRAVTPEAGQRLVSQFFDRATHSGGWIQQSAAPATTAGIADTTPSGHWGLVAVSIGVPSAQAARTSRASGAGEAAGTLQLPIIDSGANVTTENASTVSSKNSPSVTGRRRTDMPTGVHSATSGPSATMTQFTYNARGDRISETTSGSPTVTFSYDQADRLIGVGDNISYAYNGDGLRVSKTVDGATSEFVWNQSEGTPELLQDGSTDYIYGPEGKPIEQITGETPIYLHQDQQGSTRLLTDAGGSVVGRYDYDAWGAVTSHTGSATTNLQYDGQYTDAETGYQYLRARYYDPSTGQFITADPLVAVTRARYIYANNAPLNQADPTGMISYACNAINTYCSVPASGITCSAGDVSICKPWCGYITESYTQLTGYGAAPTPQKKPKTSNTSAPDETSQIVKDAQECYSEETNTVTGIVQESGLSPEDDSPDGPVALWENGSQYTNTLTSSACSYSNIN
jgi:RHS repeat-associated protein